ncbi:MAG: DUF1540 domain-containing protein [Peptococcaceae bacterium]|nr:DUF1540 domain-containing protein [Peptococcaceae bacterium]
MSKVAKCLVEECHFNNNTTCHADNIQVRSSNNVVTTAAHTSCETFRPKQNAMK